jgi:hypothetical protein
MNNDWIQTVDGRAFHFLDPRPEDIDIEVVAHVLSREGRWGNHLKMFYSVAEHCYRVSYVCEPQDALWGLLHDLAEAYLRDISTPIKRHLRHGVDEVVRRLKLVMDLDPVLEGMIRGACSDMLGYDEMERRIMRAACTKFGLPEQMPESVVRADAVLLVTEKRDLAAPPPLPWGRADVEPLPYHINDPWTPKMARELFLRRFEELTRRNP